MIQQLLKENIIIVLSIHVVMEAPRDEVQYSGIKEAPLERNRLTHSVTAASLEERERREAGMLLQILKNLFFGVFWGFFVCLFCFFTLGKT